VGEKQACPFRWPGQYEDEETGLYYNRFRYYDPESGEYVSQDPIGLRGGMAFCAYVRDPLKLIDPFGLSSCSSKKPIIIGEDMTGRVDKFAKMMDADTISDRLKKEGRTWSQAANDEFVEAMKKEGREIHDIGPAFARRAGGHPPSAVYAGELKQLAGYDKYTSWFGGGGVPGFD
jgi:RHS repeat-associated protein